jgi:hypothetical protein
VRFRERGKLKRSVLARRYTRRVAAVRESPLRGLGLKLKGVQSGALYGRGSVPAPSLGPKPFSRTTGFVQDTRRDLKTCLKQS